MKRCRKGLGVYWGCNTIAAHIYPVAGTPSSPPQMGVSCRRGRPQRPWGVPALASGHGDLSAAASCMPRLPIKPVQCTVVPRAWHLQALDQGWRPRSIPPSSAAAPLTLGAHDSIDHSQDHLCCIINVHFEEFQIVSWFALASAQCRVPKCSSCGKCMAPPPISHQHI